MSNTKISNIPHTQGGLGCHIFTLLKGEELLSKTPKSTTSDSYRDSSLDSQALDITNLATRKGNPTHNKHLQGNLLCHSKHCEETQPESPATPLVCHSEGFMPEESLQESPVANSNSSWRLRHGNLREFLAKSKHKE